MLAVLLIIPVLAWLANRKFFAKNYKNVTLSALSAILVYIFILIINAYFEQKLDAELAAFDLNGDGVFSSNEKTPEQEKAMYRVISDTGRTFAPITGAIFSFIYFMGIWFVFTLISWVGKRHEAKNT